MKRITKWIIAGGAVAISIAIRSSGVAHESASPVFCLPTLRGPVCSEIPGWELIGGFGG